MAWMVRLIVITWLLVPGGLLSTGTAVSAQASAPQEEFRPVAPGELQEQLPATPLVFTAYGIVWLVLAFYLGSLWRRMGQVEAELQTLSKRVEGRGP